jgi:dTMP kinase
MVFVVIDGLDASGKSTQARRLRDALKKRGKSVYLRVHPSDDGWAGVWTRRFLLSEGRGAHFASAFLYVLDIVQSAIRCPWRLYDYIVFVRYLMGTAYLPPPMHRIAYHFFAVLLPRPGFRIFLDVDPEEAHRRIVESRREREMFESLEQLREVRGKALSLALMNGWTIVDANRSEEEVEAQIWESLHERDRSLGI